MHAGLNMTWHCVSLKTTDITSRNGRCLTPSSEEEEELLLLSLLDPLEDDDDDEAEDEEDEEDEELLLDETLALFDWPLDDLWSFLDCLSLETEAFVSLADSFFFLLLSSFWK